MAENPAERPAAELARRVPAEVTRGGTIVATRRVSAEMRPVTAVGVLAVTVMVASLSAGPTLVAPSVRMVAVVCELEELRRFNPVVAVVAGARAG